MKTVMAEVRKNPSIIIFIDEIHTIIGAGAAEGAVDAANIIKPALARGEMQLIGATTISEYRRHIEKDAALERRFQSVMVGEPSEEEAIRILEGLRDRYESHHKVKITDEAIDAAVKLSVRYINDRYLPDKAIDLIDEAASKKRIAAHTSPPDLREAEDKVKALRADKEEAIKSQDFELAASLRDEEKQLEKECEAKKTAWQNSRSGLSLSIGADDIADIVTAWTGIPVKKLANEESTKLLNLENILKERIIGQDEAVISCREGDTPRKNRAQGPEASDGLVHLPRSDRRRQDRAHKGARRRAVRRRERHDPRRYVGVYGEALGIEDDRLASRLCRV